MKRVFLLAGAALVAASVQPASANDRYAERPPVVVSPDLSAPWVIQLGHKPGKVLFKKRKAFPNEVEFAPQRAPPDGRLGSGAHGCCRAAGKARRPPRDEPDLPAAGSRL